MALGVFIVAFSVFYWWRDVIRERCFMGLHNSVVKRAHYVAIMLFIASEVLFFVSLFWAYLHSSIGVPREVGCIWPPVGIEPINYMGLPLLNTLVLLSSGATIT